MNHQRRIEQLQGEARKGKVEALVLTHRPDIRYLSGFTGSNAVLLLLPRRAVLLTDSRYTTQAREEAAGSRIQVIIAKQLLPKAAALLVRSGAGSAAFDPNHIPVSMLARMEASLPESMSKAARRRFFRPLASSLTAPLRAVKDAEEMACMEEAAALGCRIFEQTLPHLVAGVPEREIAAELEYTARRGGADGMSFPTIVAGGGRSALPHGEASAAKLPKRGFVTLDFGVMLRGYCSDMTRTVYLGKPTREEKAAYAAVLEAEQAGIAAVRAGVRAGAVDAAARGVLRREELAQYFTHSTGHGLGLEIHERPRLGAKVKDRLETGMTVTIEPGVYLPGRFGIRIEDTVAVEAEGSRVLTASPRELLTL